MQDRRPNLTRTAQRPDSHSRTANRQQLPRLRIATLRISLKRCKTVDKLWIDQGNNRGLLLEKLSTNLHLAVDISDSQEVAQRTQSTALYSQANKNQPVDKPVDSVDNLTTNKLPQACLDRHRKIVEETPGFSLLVAAHAFSYTLLVLYESVVRNDQFYQSLVGQVNNLDALIFHP